MHYITFYFQVPISFNSQFLNLAVLWCVVLFDFGIITWMGQSLMDEVIECNFLCNLLRINEETAVVFKLTCH